MVEFSFTTTAWSKSSCVLVALSAACNCSAASTPLSWKAAPLAGWKLVRLAAAAVVGALWLLVLFVFSYFRLPEPPTPKVRDIPWPTLLILGGVLLGWVVAVVSRAAAKVGAKRRGAKARRQLEDRVTGVADELILAPLHAELAAYQDFGAAVERARGSR